ncbi:MAG: hypothetical protein CMD92_09000 [Gammaproteobacteria bacterium]|nr:hypothetical protein [Gammaproteobacteria bacterium]
MLASVGINSWHTNQAYSLRNRKVTAHRAGKVSFPTTGKALLVRVYLVGTEVCVREARQHEAFQRFKNGAG